MRDQLARRSTRRLLCAVVPLTALLSSGRADADPFAECERQFAARPSDYEASLCFYKAAASQQAWDVGRRHLDRLRRSHPDLHWPTLCLAYVEYAQGLPAAEGLFRTAADGFRARGEAKGEVLARLNLGTYLLVAQGRTDDAEKEIRRATEVAQASGDPELRARSLVGAAQLIEHRGTDLEGGYRLLRQVESLRDVPPTVRKTALHLLGNLAHQLSRYDDAIRHYRDLVELLGEAHLQQDLAAALYSIANSMLEKSVELPAPGAREEVLAAAERALRASVESGNVLIEAVSRALVARLVAADPAQRDFARDYLERCVELAGRSLQPQRQSECLWYLSDFVAERDPAAAARHVARAIEIADTSGDRWFVPFAWRYRTKLEFRAGPRQEAIDDGLRLLDVIETFRELQVGGEGRAGVLSRWAGDYYRLSGELLRGGDGRRETELAFLVAERLRARLLLDRRSSLHASAPADPAVAARRQEVLEAISRVQRRLLRPDLQPGERAEALRSLDELKPREAGLRDQLARAAPTPAFAGLRDVQELLAGDEALLSFQVGLGRDLFGDFEGGAWLLVVTRRDVFVHRIPDRVELEGMVPVFTGLFAARDGGEVAPAVALHERLLAPALADLPDGVSRLVIIPDGRLHQLPFPALRAGPGGPPLGLRYALSIVPSATLWASWRRAARLRAEKAVWVFADPAAGPARAGATERGWLADPAQPLGALPHARAEGEQITRAVPGGGELSVGAGASERALKAGRLASFSMIHFAAHAVIDEERPEQSAVLLAPGGDAEDGLLQPIEIADLDLDGKVVVLSGCRTASGKLMRGEGVLGLAHSFFEAGATAVVGSLWPLRDDEAALFFGQLYGYLGRGERLDRAVQLAQEAAVERGAPGSAWAGIVLLGDGSIVPFPSERRARAGAPWKLALTALLALGLGASWNRRRRHADQGTHS